MENLIAQIQMELREVVNKHKNQISCNVKEENFILSKFKNFTIPHFYIIWKILKNPLVGRPIVARRKRFDKDCFLFTIDFKSLYTNVPVEDAIH